MTVDEANALSIPHASGDEPLLDALQPVFEFVYPTRVGMNRQRPFGFPLCLRIPHASGDEPLL